jgi:ParB family chromosome partitioning protein
MARKDVFANVMKPAMDNEAGAIAPASLQPVKKTLTAGPIASLKGSLGSMREQAQRVEKIEKQLAEGQAIVELDPADVEVSFVRDRMIYPQEEHEKLVAAIRDQGQIVPILTRPHPQQPGRYQVAFGHRRLRAVSELGIKVRAVVRDLTDEQLVIAQGQENNERTDLTYIEKARFAAHLEEKEFSRETIIQALCLDKGSVSKLLKVMKRVPLEVVDWIGHAPSIGRPRWEELSELLDHTNVEKVRDFIGRDDVQNLATDERFQAIYKLLTAKEVSRKPSDHWVAKSGAKVAKYTEDDKKFSFVIDKKVAPDFGQFLLGKMDSLFEEFNRQSSK